MESSIITIMYIFSFFHVFKLYKSGLQIIDLISGYLMYLRSVDIGDYLVLTYFESLILTLGYFSDVFCDP